MRVIFPGAQTAQLQFDWVFWECFPSFLHSRLKGTKLSFLQSFVRLDHIRKCFTQKGGIFVLEEFSKSKSIVSVLIVGPSYGARNVLSYTRRRIQNFLAFRDSPIIPLRRSPLGKKTDLKWMCSSSPLRPNVLPTDPKTRHVTQRRYSSSLVSTAKVG